MNCPKRRRKDRQKISRKGRRKGRPQSMTRSIFCRFAVFLILFMLSVDENLPEIVLCYLNISSLVKVFN
jgi:hypothetical protein